MSLHRAIYVVIHFLLPAMFYVELSFISTDNVLELARPHQSRDPGIYESFPGSFVLPSAGYPLAASAPVLLCCGRLALPLPEVCRVSQGDARRGRDLEDRWDRGGGGSGTSKMTTRGREEARDGRIDGERVAEGVDHREGD